MSTHPVVDVIVEGGLVRGVYLDGEYVVGEAVWDFDAFDSGDEDDAKELEAAVRTHIAGSPTSDLSRDLATYLS